MLTILIVDDRRDAIEILQSKLQQKGFVTESTQDARLIPDICERQAIDAIIMDMNMPELDGCEATELLKAAEATAKIPVIICTAQLMDGDKERAIQAGCDGFIEKPVHLGTLMSILAQFFEVDKDDIPSEIDNNSERILGNSEAIASVLPLDADTLAVIVSTPHPIVPEPNFIADRPCAADQDLKDKDLLPCPSE